jgi:aminoacrylate peracid reductase
LNQSEAAENPHVIVNPGWKHYDRLTFAPAIRSGNLLFVSGMTATDDEGNIVGEGDIVAQARCIFQKLDAVLRAGGARPCDVVKTTDYITTTEDYAATAAVRREFFGEHSPAATGVVVSALLRPGALIEIEAVAVIPDRSHTGDGRVDG